MLNGALISKLFVAVITLSFDFHVHTHRSIDSAMDPKHIGKIMKRKGLDGIAVTDHNSIKGALEVAKQATSELYIIVGSEIKTPIGEILGLFLTEEISSSNPFEVIEEIRAQGGLTVLPHPFRAHTFTRAHLLNNMKIVEQVDAIEVFNARTPNTANQQALLLAREMNKPMVAGSDAHFYPELGRARTLLPPFNDQEELKNTILNGNTTIEEASFYFLRALPFCFLSFIHNRVNKFTKKVH
jgi:predicted metal-dependent phosphoesterase TrpH